MPDSALTRITDENGRFLASVPLPIRLRAWADAQKATNADDQMVPMALDAANQLEANALGLAVSAERIGELASALESARARIAELEASAVVPTQNASGGQPGGSTPLPQPSRPGYP
jgi:hypothetical protein